MLSNRMPLGSWTVTVRSTVAIPSLNMLPMFAERVRFKASAMKLTVVSVDTVPRVAVTVAVPEVVPAVSVA